jgi:FtsP/CotA-like multicopper oxidase with cupredoxin domain
MTESDGTPRTGAGPLLGLLATTVAVAAIAVILVGVVAVVTDEENSPAGAAGESAPAPVMLSDFSIDGTLDVPTGGSLDVMNDGAVVHDLAVTGTDLATPQLDPGESAALDLASLEPGEYEVFCQIPGHADSGMRAPLTIADDAAPSSGSEMAGTDHGGEGTDQDWAALDLAMTESILEFPAETEGKGNTPLEPEVASDGTKLFELTAAITPWEIEPGVIVDAWTYNGQVPGPAIHLDQGDKVRVIVNNELPMGTDVHWHGIHTPNDQDGVAPITQDLIESGDTFTYQFVAEDPAIGMYHAHHHGQMQIPNGLFGQFQIDDLPLPTGQTISGVTLPDQIELTTELPMVLNDAGVIGLTLNGKSFPATAPIVLKQNEWGLVHYQNEGLQVHPMHMHGFRQLVVAKDGVPLDQPYWVDTVNVAPGERYSILFQADRVGTWVWHCHILNHVEREEGMFGMVSAVVVEEQ